MNRNYTKAFRLFMLLCAAGLFVMVGLAQAEEEAYDEDTYGPEAPIVWTAQKEMPEQVTAVVFIHKRHTMEAGLSCDSCHDDLFQMAAGTAQGNGDFTMQSLYAGKYCGACHDGSTAFAANTRCATCHIGVKGHKRLTGATQEGEHGEAHH